MPVSLIALIGLVVAWPAALRADSLADAQMLVLHGEYEQAISTLQQLVSHSPSVEASTLLGQVLVLLGRHREAAEVLRPLAVQDSPSMDAIVAYSNLLVARGQLNQALHQLEAAFALDGSHPQVRLLRGEIRARLGQQSRARRDFQEIAASYQSGQVSSARHMTTVGIAYQRLGRYEEANSIFGLALQMDPSSLETRMAWASLLYQKYRPDQAEQLAREILDTNPHHPSALVLLGRIAMDLDHDLETSIQQAYRALEVNPYLPEARELLAEVALDDERYGEAEGQVGVVLEVNPTRLESLSLLAAAYFLQDDHESFRQLEQQVIEINPHYAAFYCLVARFTSRTGWVEETAELYRKALEIDPNDALASLGLGLALSRMGDDNTGLTYLRQARERDPFNIQAYHLVQFQETTLAEYEIVQSANLRFRFHREERPVLELYVVPLMEWVYQQLVQRYQFEPEGPITIELFPDAQTLAIRSTGLLQVDAHGISFGRVVTGRSPSEGNHNWAEVLAHELSHCFTLQLSRARIPRWLTEGMAEFDTHLLRPEWRREGHHTLIALLEMSRLPGIQQLSQAFIRVQDMESTLANYHLSMLAVQFLTDRWGQDSPLRILGRLAQGHRFPDALRDVTGLSVSQFDVAFDGYLRELLQPLMGTIEPTPIRYQDQESLEARVRADPANADAWADLAMAKFFSLRVEESESAYRRTLELDPDHPLGHLLAGWFAARQRRYEEGLAHFQRILDAGYDGYNVRVELAALARRTGRTSEAILHFRRAQQIYPQGSQSYRDLADIYLRSGEVSAATTQLTQLIALDQWDLQSILRLLGLLVRQERYQQAWEACIQANQVNPFAPTLHHTCARVAIQLGRWEEARTEVQAALLLEDGSPQELTAMLDEILANQPDPAMAPEPAQTADEPPETTSGLLPQVP